MITVVFLLCSDTLGSDVFSMRLKVWFPSNALSFISIMCTHLFVSLVDPEEKVRADEKIPI